MDDERQQVPSSEDQAGQRSGLGALWLLLAPVACCGGPLLIGALAAADALAWGALGLGVALAAAVVVTVVMRRRASQECCPPVTADSARAAGTPAGLRA